MHDADLRARLERGHPVLVDYDPVWAARFEEVSCAILAAAAPHLERVEHIGSTAVSGLGAKPVLDLLPVIRADASELSFVDAMRALGYTHKGEYGIPGRTYFSKHTPEDRHVFKHHVHAYRAGHGEIERHLAFRDALRDDPALRDEYWHLKRDLAHANPTDAEAYAQAKDPFVDRVVAAKGAPARARR